MTTTHKMAVALALCVTVFFFAYRSSRDGPPKVFPQRMETGRDTQSSANLPSEAIVTLIPTVPVTPGVARSTPASATLAEQVRAGMNAERAFAGLAPLSVDVRLQSMAEAHATDMAGRGYFSHTTPDSVTFEVRIKESGYPGSVSAENLGLTSQDPVGIIDGWMRSEGHRANILNGQYADVGIGSAQGVWQGLAVTFVVAVFGGGK